MPNRMMISQESQPIPCEECGHPTLHVARLVSDEGQLVGQTLICTQCRRHRHEQNLHRTT